MNLTEKQEKGQELVNSLITKCWEDEAFKKELIANPVETIENYTGEKLDIPADRELVFVDQTDKQNLYINISEQPNLDELNLTDEQLEMVAGGVSPTVGLLLYFSAGASSGYIIGQLFK